VALAEGGIKGDHHLHAHMHREDVKQLREQLCLAACLLLASMLKSHEQQQQQAPPHNQTSETSAGRAGRAATQGRTSIESRSRSSWLPVVVNERGAGG
jgi:hypothetical protein